MVSVYLTLLKYLPYLCGATSKFLDVTLAGEDFVVTRGRTDADGGHLNEGDLV